MSDIAFFTAVFATAGIVGGIAGCAVTLLAVRRIILAWLPRLPYILSVEDIHIRTSLILNEDDDGGVAIEEENRVRINASGITSEFVSQWLDERGLVMSPKGFDLKKKVSVKP